MTRRRPRTGELAGLLTDGGRRAGVAWLLVAGLLAGAGRALAGAAPAWAVVGLVAALVAVAPAVAWRDPGICLPPGLLVVLVGGHVLRSAAPAGVQTDVAVSVTAAALATAVVVVLDALTDVRLTRGVAAGVVAVTTTAGAGAWAVLRWALDELVGTGLLAPPDTPPAVVEERVLAGFVVATVVAALAGLVLAVVLGRRTGAPGRRWL